MENEQTTERPADAASTNGSAQTAALPSLYPDYRAYIDAKIAIYQKQSPASFKHMFDSFLQDDEQERVETLAYLKKALNEGRSPDNKVFP